MSRDLCRFFWILKNFNKTIRFRRFLFLPFLIAGRAPLYFTFCLPPAGERGTACGGWGVIYYTPPHQSPSATASPSGGSLLGYFVIFGDSPPGRSPFWLLRLLWWQLFLRGEALLCLLGHLQWQPQRKTFAFAHRYIFLFPAHDPRVLFKNKSGGHMTAAFANR